MDSASSLGYRVAISNRRLIAFDQNGVTFRYKERAQSSMSAAAWMGARLSRDAGGRASQHSAASAFVNRSTAAALSIATRAL